MERTEKDSELVAVGSSGNCEPQESRNERKVPYSKIYRMRWKMKITIRESRTRVTPRDMTEGVKKDNRVTTGKPRKRVRFNENVEVFEIPARGEECGLV